MWDVLDTTSDKFKFYFFRDFSRGKASCLILKYVLDPFLKTSSIEATKKLDILFFLWLEVVCVIVLFIL